MGDSITTYLLTQGVLGVSCIVLAYVCVKLYNRTVALQARIDALQDARLQDSKDVTKDVTAVLEGNAQNMRILSEKIEVGRGRR